jgi:glycosyltransferase involved in cell wall biosynthesis
MGSANKKTNQSNILEIERNPAVSIVMSVYNAERWVNEVFKTICGQTYQCYEVIVINDGSTDDTKRLILEQCARDCRVRYLENKINKGLTRSLNKALSKAKGDLVSRIDVDDLWEPEKLRKQVEYLSMYPEVALVGTAYLDINSQGNVLGNPKVKFVETDYQIRKAICKFNPFFHSSVVFRREIYEKLGGYNEKYYYAQDYEYWVRILSKYKAYNIPETLAYHRIDKNNISVRKEKKQRFFSLLAKLKAMSRQKKYVENLDSVLKDLLVIVLPRSVSNTIRKTIN